MVPSSIRVRRRTPARHTWVERLERRVLLSGDQSPGFVNEPVAAGAELVAPTSMAFAPDGRLFVTLQRGSLRVLHDVARPGGAAVPSTEFSDKTGT